MKIVNLDRKNKFSLFLNKLWLKEDYKKVDFSVIHSFFRAIQTINVSEQAHDKK